MILQALIDEAIGRLVIGQGLFHGLEGLVLRRQLMLGGCDLIRQSAALVLLGGNILGNLHNASLPVVMEGLEPFGGLAVAVEFGLQCRQLHFQINRILSHLHVHIL